MENFDMDAGAHETWKAFAELLRASDGKTEQRRPGMTVAEVRRATAELQAAGKPASQRAVMQHLGLKSKRIMGELMQALKAEDEAREPPPVPVPPVPTPADPVEQAKQRLAQAELGLAEAREALLQAKVTLLATRNLAIDGVLHGSLHSADEVHQLVVEETDDLKRHYDLAWREREDARAELARMEAQHLRGKQERWVLTHQPELLQQRDDWREKLRTAPTDRWHAEYKKNFQEAQMAYEYAVRTAPVSGEG
jgi:hypothetical protein